MSPKHLDKSVWAKAVVPPQVRALTARAKDLCSNPQHSCESWAWLHMSEAQVLGRRADRSCLGACQPATLAETGAFRFTKRQCLKSKAKRSTGGHLRYSPILCVDSCRRAPTPHTGTHIPNTHILHPHKHSLNNPRQQHFKYKIYKIIDENEHELAVVFLEKISLNSYRQTHGRLSTLRYNVKYKQLTWKCLYHISCLSNKYF